jgi:hypothetical protein
MSSVYAIFKAANLRKVIFYCGLSPLPNNTPELIGMPSNS